MVSRVVYLFILINPMDLVFLKKVKKFLVVNLGQWWSVVRPIGPPQVEVLNHPHLFFSFFYSNFFLFINAAALIFSS